MDTSAYFRFLNFNGLQDKKTRLDSLHFAAPYKELREIYVYLIYNETNKTNRTFQIFKNGPRACHNGPTCCPRSRVITSRIQKPNNVISF